MKMAGIDVHKKVPLVVVIDASMPERSHGGGDLAPCRANCSDFCSGYGNRQ
jgi:hypothetical protein